MKKQLLPASPLIAYCRWGVLLLVLFAGAVRRPVAAQPTKFTREDVTFERAGATLAGTILRPRHPVAAVVLVHGSGQEKRLLEFALFLAGQGFAVLTYDKRGVGASGGVYAGPEVGTNNVDAANLNLLAGDASAAAATLAAHLPRHQPPVGLLGFSQAGWVIPLAAKQNPTVRFMVLFSGPVVTAREQLRFQFFTQGKAGFWDTHTEAEARAHLHHDPDRYQFADTDANEALGTLAIPGLWLYGGQDVQAPVGLSTEHLDALKALGKPYQYQLFAALGHNTAFARSSSEPVRVAIDWMKVQARARPDK